LRLPWKIAKAWASRKSRQTQQGGERTEHKRYGELTKTRKKPQIAQRNRRGGKTRGWACRGEKTSQNRWPSPGKLSPRPKENTAKKSKEGIGEKCSLFGSKKKTNRKNTNETTLEDLCSQLSKTTKTMERKKKNIKLIQSK